MNINEYYKNLNEILLNRLLKPNITPYLDDVIRHLENLINKIENN